MRNYSSAFFKWSSRPGPRNRNYNYNNIAFSPWPHPTQCDAKPSSVAQPSAMPLPREMFPAMPLPREMLPSLIPHPSSFPDLSFVRLAHCYISGFFGKKPWKSRKQSKTQFCQDIKHPHTRAEVRRHVYIYKHVNIHYTGIHSHTHIHTYKHINTFKYTYRHIHSLCLSL